MIYSIVSQCILLNDLKSSLCFHSVSCDQFRESVVAAVVPNAFTRS